MIVGVAVRCGDLGIARQHGCGRVKDGQPVRRLGLLSQALSAVNGLPGWEFACAGYQWVAWGGEGCGGDGVRCRGAGESGGWRAEGAGDICNSSLAAAAAEARQARYCSSAS